MSVTYPAIGAGTTSIYSTHRLHSCFFGDYLIGFQNINHKKELLWSLWVNFSARPRRVCRHRHTPRCAQGIPAWTFKMHLQGFELTRFQVQALGFRVHGVPVFGLEWVLVARRAIDHQRRTLSPYKAQLKPSARSFTSNCRKSNFIFCLGSEPTLLYTTPKPQDPA